jgi:phage terminase large subunit-like protein
MLNASPAQLLTSLPEAEQAAAIAALTPETQAELAYHWPFWARADQLIPLGVWTYWLILAGRGWGKTRTGAETVREWVKTCDMVNLIGATVDDARDIMIEGESGILAVCPRDERPDYKKSERKLVWPNGAISLIFTADEPERLRGKQHKKLWADEMAAWRYQEAWDQAKFGLRLGTNPQAVVTTTPRPVKNVLDLTKDRATLITKGTTYDNRANLAPSFFAQIVNRYEGTRLGRQELNAELLLDVPGALWTREMIPHMPRSSVPQLMRIVVGVDPSASSQSNSNECGIVVDGMAGDGQAFCLADRSGVMSPEEWAKAAVTAYKEFQADCIVAEVNQGGEMVRAVIQSVDPYVPIKMVHAARGKYIRAEPISALYARRNVYHCEMFEALEDQMCTFTPDFDRSRDGSPDRLDAHVWAMTELFPALAMPIEHDDEDDFDRQRASDTRNATTGY